MIAVFETVWNLRGNAFWPGRATHVAWQKRYLDFPEIFQKTAIQSANCCVHSSVENLCITGVQRKVQWRKAMASAYDVARYIVTFFQQAGCGMPGNYLQGFYAAVFYTAWGRA
jgi:hypothetical protein